MNLVALMLAVLIMGGALGLMGYWALLQVLPARLRVLALDPNGGPARYVRAKSRGSYAEATIQGKDARVPLDKVGFPFRGTTLYVVDASSGVPYDFRALDKSTVPGHVDAYRIAAEARSVNHENLQRAEPEGLAAVIMSAMPVLFLVALALLGIVVFGVGRINGWW